MDQFGNGVEHFVIDTARLIVQGGVGLHVSGSGVVEGMMIIRLMGGQLDAVIQIGETKLSETGKFRKTTGK